MEGLTYKDGKDVANAIDSRVMNIVKLLLSKSPYTILDTGVVQSVPNESKASTKSRYIIKINNATYINVNALKNIGEVKVGDTVVVAIPNNQYSNMFILGALDT